MYIENQDLQYRAQNQTLRQQLRQRLDEFLRPQPQDLEPLAEFISTMALPPPSVQAPPTASPADVDSYTPPTAISTTPVIASHLPAQDSYQESLLSSTSGDAYHPVISASPGCQSYPVQQARTMGIIGVLINPSDTVAPETAMNANQAPLARIQPYYPTSMGNQATALYNDLAQGLENTMESNCTARPRRGSDTIERLAARGLAVDSLTGVRRT